MENQQCRKTLSVSKIYIKPSHLREFVCVDEISEFWISTSMFECSLKLITVQLPTDSAPVFEFSTPAIKSKQTVEAFFEFVERPILNFESFEIVQIIHMQTVQEVQKVEL